MRLTPVLHSPSKRSRLRLDRLAVTIIPMLGVFYIGMLVGMYNGRNDQVTIKSMKQSPQFEEAVRQQVQMALARQQPQKQQQQKLNSLQQRTDGGAGPPLVLRFGEHMARYALGGARIPRHDFTETFDSGYPKPLGDDPAADEVLILYNQQKALPEFFEHSAKYNEGDELPKLSAMEATRNCQTLHIISTRAPSVQQCVALVGQYEAPHVQRWMRINPKGGKQVDNKLPLVSVGRGQQANGYNQFLPPGPNTTMKHMHRLQIYLETLEETLETLKPLVQTIAATQPKGSVAIVVMVCNLGQADLLMNFVCSNQAKALPIHNILVFATDQATYDIATALGLTAYYDETNFKHFPSSEAKSYGDHVFSEMMYAKVLSVQLVNMLGYDVLFQDVDIVWYKNPLAVFQDRNSALQQFDMIFQDDGARSVRYAPYAANSGFYYVRHNAKTRHLLTSLLYAGDRIIYGGSHQEVLTAVMAEHSSLYGLRVKTMTDDDFPGGYHFHRRKDVMQSIVKGEAQPWIFHMSWTHDKQNKVLFFQQMGLWYVAPKCQGKGAQDELHKGERNEYMGRCCSPEPLVSCHFKDKPSVIPCNDSPALDKQGKAFWTEVQ